MRRCAKDSSCAIATGCGSRGVQVKGTLNFSQGSHADLRALSSTHSRNENTRNTVLMMPMGTSSIECGAMQPTRI